MSARTTAVSPARAANHSAVRPAASRARCHNPNGWQLWRFDHGRETEFPLAGAHAKLACDQCHRAPAGSGAATPSRCGGCHAKDDPHAGAFGRGCERCHADTSWSDVEIHR